MKNLIIALVVFLTTVATVQIQASPENTEMVTIISPDDEDGLTYEYVEIDGKMYVYVYDGDYLVQVYEVEE